MNYDFIKIESKTESNVIYIMESSTMKNADIKGKVIKTVNGSELVGMNYEPVFPYLQKLNGNMFKICTDPYVSSCVESGVGTGIVHLSPAFGEDDWRVCTEKNIITSDAEIIKLCCPLNEDCIFNDTITDFAGVFILDAEPEIIKHLKTRNLLQKIYMFQHEYPYCYRTETPLIYRTINAVYIKVTELKEKLLEMNKKITWYPAHIGEKRFNSWLENVRDWCVSRSRYFGTPIPMWVSEDGNDIKVIGSIAELEKLVGVPLNLTDIHPEFIDSITFEINGIKYKRIPDVFDCWFESGCVPYGQLHYPFENSSYFDEKEFLSDFIIEGIDQTRGWFYTLLVLSTALLNKPAFKQVNVVGLVLDENGEKFSKKKKNYVDANIAIEQDGADVLRMYVMSSPLTQGEPLRFKQQDVMEIKQKFIQLINSVKFYVEHTINMENKKDLIPNIDIINHQERLESNFLNGWIWELVRNLTKTVEISMNAFNVSSAVNSILDFIEDFTNYYIKLNRESLKGFRLIDDWVDSLGVLYNVLKTFLTVLAPFAPFTAEYLYNQIKKIDENNLESVHFYKFPVFIKELKFVDKFNLLKRILKLVRAERFKSVTHSSQKKPIKECQIRMNDQEKLNNIKQFIHLIEPELNCINLIYGTYNDSLEYSIEVNHQTIGKAFRSDAIYIKEKLTQLTQDEMARLFETKHIMICNQIKNVSYEITDGMFKLKQIPKNKENTVIDDDLMIQLDLTYSTEIIHQYVANCFVTYFQAHRKRVGLRPWNKVEAIIIDDSNNIMKNFKEIVEGRLKVPLVFNTTDNTYSQVFNDSYKYTLENGEIIEIKYDLSVI